MSRLMLVCSLTAAGALAWWVAAPSAFPMPSALGVSPPPKAGDPDLLKISTARWRGPGRKPLFEPVAAAPAVDSAALRLIGAASMPGRRAALISVNGAKPTWLEVGEAQGGLTLIDVGPGRAVVRAGGGETTLTVFAPPPKPPTDKDQHAG